MATESKTLYLLHFDWGMFDQDDSDIQEIFQQNFLGATTHVEWANAFCERFAREDPRRGLLRAVYTEFALDDSETFPESREREGGKTIDKQ